jgi:ribonuclease-3 family protein
MHREAVGRVSARAQAQAAARLLPALDAFEAAVFKRGRNARVNSPPRGAAQREYHAATGLEALFGFLYLKGEHGRLGELFDIIWADERCLNNIVTCGAAERTDNKNGT